jgi:hypothetical protein
MAEVNSVSEPAEGQLSDDGRSFWSNGVWASSVSADGESRWDGHGWVPHQRTFFQDVPDEQNLDDRSMAKGSVPRTVKSLPAPTSYEDHHVAVGSGWVAMRAAPAGGWQLIQTRDIQSVALVPRRRSVKSFS